MRGGVVTLKSSEGSPFVSSGALLAEDVGGAHIDVHDFLFDLGQSHPVSENSTPGSVPFLTENLIADYFDSEARPPKFKHL